mgnify:CR=1 FL=1
MSDAMAVNNAEFRVIKLLGKGKGGYSYLVTNRTTQYVLKQIHHEPCEYYAFGDKLRSELRDYETLRKLGIPMPRLLAVDAPQERILKEYIAGATVAELLKEGRMEPDWLAQVQAMCSLLYPAGLNIDYYPTNFVPCDGMLYYIDYECNTYMEQWDFEHWGIQYWTARQWKGRRKHENPFGGQAPLCFTGASRTGGFLRHLFCKGAGAKAPRYPDPADRAQKGKIHSHG